MPGLSLWAVLLSWSGFSGLVDYAFEAEMLLRLLALIMIEKQSFASRNEAKTWNFKQACHVSNGNVYL